MVNFKVNNIQIYVFKVKKQKKYPLFFQLTCERNSGKIPKTNTANV